MPKFSLRDGAQEVARLDADFFSALLTPHNSGLSLLAASDEISDTKVPKSAVMRMVTLAREQFAYIVVDAGSRHGEWQETLFHAASVVYLVAQVSIADLRNANRLIRRYFEDAEPGHLQIVLNRFQTRGLEIDEAAITKALTQPVNWKVPNDYVAARKAQNTGIAMVSNDSQISRILVEMSREAAGQPVSLGKRKKFGLFS
jgi:pilus assembly protein CpaE